MTISDPVRVVNTVTTQRVAISAATSGTHTIVAAAAGKRTKVLGVLLMGGGAVNVKFTNGAGGADLTGSMPLATEGNGLVMPVTPPGLHWLETSVNTALVLYLSGTVQVSGVLVYYQE